MKRLLLLLIISANAHVAIGSEFLRCSAFLYYPIYGAKAEAQEAERAKDAARHKQQRKEKAAIRRQLIECKRQEANELNSITGSPTQSDRKRIKAFIDERNAAGKTFEQELEERIYACYVAMGKIKFIDPIAQFATNYLASPRWRKEKIQLQQKIVYNCKLSVKQDKATIAILAELKQKASR